MSEAKRDPLLTTVWWMLTILLVLCVGLGVFCLLAYPVMLLNEAYFVAGFAKMGIAPSALPWIGILGGLAAAELGLTFSFLLNLRRIIDGVAQGQPFAPANAGHLRRMAWLSVAMQIVGVPITRMLVWFDAMPHKPHVHHHAHGISVGTIILTLVLFVLARVFRTGAEMQQDLEGTV